MRVRLGAVLCALPLVAACSDSKSASPYDDDFPVSEDNVNDGAPNNDSLPDDNKADAVYPAQFTLPLAEQSPVKSQGSRGVCSIFAATALVENLYIKAGMSRDDADFSEQYMQWAVKNLTHAFPNSEGSSADANLRTVVQYGTVKEAEWRYETFPWTAANDPACTGGEEGLPTRCFTNGEPPANVAAAQKFKVPQSRWINTNSIKANLTTGKVGVNVGLTFFYQAWNHRSSTLPIDNELWRRGIITYPNADDKTESAKHRAGHAIEIVGWDDDLEVTMRDKDNNPVVVNGVVQKEKGFYVIKNSWGTASFGVENTISPGYGYLSMKYVAEYGSAVTADPPVLHAAEVCDDAGMADEDGNGKANCADPACAAHPACAGGGTAHDYTAAPNASIPDNDPTGASSTIDVTDTGTLTDVKVTVDITHTYRGDLKVTLTHGSSVVLFDRQGGSADDLKQTFTATGLSGQPLAGAWTLSVVDTAAQDVGTLNSWTLEATAN